MFRTLRFATYASLLALGGGVLAPASAANLKVVASSPSSATLPGTSAGTASISPRWSALMVTPMSTSRAPRMLSRWSRPMSCSSTAWNSKAS
jgi:hypothetical protein